MLPTSLRCLSASALLFATAASAAPASVAPAPVGAVD